MPHGQYPNNKRSRRTEKRSRMNAYSDMVEKNHIGNSNQSRGDRN